MKPSNENLLSAYLNQDDEFYTRLDDIEQELTHYFKFLRGKVIYCNCDNPYKSNFVKYFLDHFEEIQIKHLFATNYAEQSLFEDSEEIPYFLSASNKSNVEVKQLSENGDFQSLECIDILKESDVVITNPPFSLFREFVSLMEQYHKQYLIIGNKNALGYVEVFNLFKSNNLRLGYSKIKGFNLPSEEQKDMRNLCKWFTTLPVKKTVHPITLKCSYSPDKYFHYENFDAIEVNKSKDIPYDYFGVMGVPVSFLVNYNPNQFKLLGMGGDSDWVLNNCPFFTPPNIELQKKYKRLNSTWRVTVPYYLKDGVPVKPFTRIFIQRIT